MGCCSAATKLQASILPAADNDDLMPAYEDSLSPLQTSIDTIFNALKGSDFGRLLPTNLVSLIVECLKQYKILLCSHNGTDIVAYNVRGELLGTLAKAPPGRQWVTGYVASIQ